MSRKIRGLTQRLYLIESIISNDQYEKIYAIMGSTGNVYHVTITNMPTCTCPDYTTRNRRCKHIYFTLIKIMNALYYEQEYYDNDELMDMFKNIPNVTNNLIVTKQIKEKYIDCKTKLHNGTQDEPIDKKDDNDLCPIWNII